MVSPRKAMCCRTREAADLLKATPMDRPEDIETNPVNGRVYAVMTKNKKITGDKLNPLNTRPENLYGHIIELIPPGGEGAKADHAADVHRWDLFVLAGNPKDPKQGQSSTRRPATMAGSSIPTTSPSIPRGGCSSPPTAPMISACLDGIYGVDTDGPARGLPKLLFSCPHGAEATGPCFTPDGKTLFVLVQHPAEDADSLDKVETRWPDFATAPPPRPAVVAIQREDGRDVGE